ncbi:MAG: alpha/beta fold hydrolase [Myxococcaceae bacterium]
MSDAAESLPPGASTARVRGHTLYYRDVGTGTPVLLLHGMGASSHVFEPLAALERKGLRLITFDLPCSGRSGAYCRATVRHVAAEATWLLDKLGVEKAIVVGHSFGGVVALELAAQHSARVSALLVAAAPAVGLPNQVRQLLDNPAGDWAMSMMGRMPANPFLTRTYLRFIFGNRAALTDRAVEGYVAAAKADRFYPSMLEGLRDLASYRIPVERLSAEKIPAEVLWGDRDRLTSAAQGEQIARAIGAPLVVLDQTGHCIPEERPEELAEAIARLAARVKPAKARASASGTKRTRR